MSAVPKDFATEAGHFYDPVTGEPRYTYTNKKGGISNTTVREARKFGWVPSVTQILKQAAAPGLVKWMKEQVAKAAYLERPREGESEADYLARILPLAEEVAARARDKGTEIHGAIEQHYKEWNVHRYGDQMPQYHEFASAAASTVREWAPLDMPEWNPERSFASPLGYGGKLDLSAPGFVADFKTTDKELADLKTWPDHRRQLAAYRMGMDMPEARCAIVYVSSVKPEARLIELDKKELELGWNEFRHLLAYYYASNKLELPK